MLKQRANFKRISCKLLLSSGGVSYLIITKVLNGEYSTMYSCVSLSLLHSNKSVALGWPAIFALFFIYRLLSFCWNVFVQTNRTIKCHVFIGRCPQHVQCLYYSSTKCFFNRTNMISHKRDSLSNIDMFYQFPFLLVSSNAISLQMMIILRIVRVVMWCLFSFFSNCIIYFSFLVCSNSLNVVFVGLIFKQKRRISSVCVK